ncbi:hypothetical protein NBRC3279_2856 [Acetobacter pasteurianus NBRC 3279]|nr:hypothetical protein NBRC3279_2856 [Acetobacter pasteurianus NBRC 3279]
MLPAQVRNRDTALSLADHTHDLGVSKAITLHQNLLNSYAEKILIQKSLFLWGDYHQDFPLSTCIGLGISGAVKISL